MPNIIRVPYPSISVLLRDLFTGTDGTNLTAHAMDVGGGWGGAVGTWILSGGRASNSVGASTGKITADAGTRDATASVIVNVANSTSGEPRGLLVRNLYRVGVAYNSNLFAITDNATQVVLASTAFTVAFGVDYTIVCVCLGDTLTATINGGNQIVYASAVSASTLFGLAGRRAGDAYETFLVTS